MTLTKQATTRNITGICLCCINVHAFNYCSGFLTNSRSNGYLCIKKGDDTVTDSKLLPDTSVALSCAGLYSAFQLIVLVFQHIILLCKHPTTLRALFLAAASSSFHNKTTITPCPATTGRHTVSG